MWTIIFWADSIFWPHGLYSPWSERKFGQKWRKWKGAKLKVSKPNLMHMHISSTSTCMNFLSWFYSLTSWTIVHGLKGKFGCFWSKQKMERPCPVNLVCMHFTETSTCINFMSQFNFLTTRTTCIVHGLKGNFSQIWSKKWAKISKTGRATPIFCWFYFWPSWTIVHGPKGKFGCFWSKRKGIKSPTLERPLSPKLVFMHMHFTSTSTCTCTYIKFEPILFFDPHGL